MRKRITLGFVSAVLLAAPFSASSDPVSPAAANPLPTSEPHPAFQQMLIYVYEQDPRIQSARQALKAQDEHVPETLAGFRPTVNASGDIGRQREAISGANWSYGTARDEALTVNQPIFNGFGTFAQFHADRARVSAERAHLTVVEEQVFLDAITAYLDVIARQRILQFDRDNRQHLQDYVYATGQRLKAGDGTETDLAQAQSRFAQSDASVTTAQANWEGARAAYQRATGLPITASDFPELPQGLPARPEDAAALARQVPELSEAAEQERASEHDVDVASSNLWPTVSVRGTMSDQLSPVLGLENLRDDSITLNVSIPLYQGGADYARIREARELHEKARDDRVDVSRTMTLRASQAWYNYHAACLIIDSSRKTVAAASRALTGVEAEHQQGLRTLQETLDQRAELLNSYIGYIQAEENMRLQAYRLLAATGKLTAESLHLDAPLYDPKWHYDKVTGAWVALQ